MTTKPNDENHRNRLSGHLLEVVDSNLVKAFYLSNPKEGRMMSTLILFTPEGIALMGDLTPERNGSVSTFGYGLSWFSGELSSSYLCEKFLAKKWLPEKAAEELTDKHFQDCFELDIETRGGLEQVARQLRGGDVGIEWLRDELHDMGLSQVMDDGMPGYGYDPREAEWLIAIQARFSELMHGDKKSCVVVEAVAS